ncbi:CLUMA_CG006579, isoform A [Clunio marinus]|uniref:CLUMA_CG006579, isoform A n=1 Tax=Clunio marinus TaxID=568069 RepID=A0A1J1I3K8_9DIPT|nr:CLUMA_CG006579, isoform A [Clunio marinus]
MRILKFSFSLIITLIIIQNVRCGDEIIEDVDAEVLKTVDGQNLLELDSNEEPILVPVDGKDVKTDTFM